MGWLHPDRAARTAFVAALLSVCSLCSAADTTATASAEKPSKTYESVKGPEAVTFLPEGIVDTSVSPTLQRGGITLPLRPEMLATEATTFTVPSIAQTTMPNGLTCYFLESHDLPSVNFTVMVRAGAQSDPPQMVGLAEIAGQTLRAGGSKSKTGDEIDRELEELGSSLEISIERELVVFRLFCLSANAERSLSLLSDVLLRPRFDQAKLDKQKELKIEAIRRQTTRWPRSPGASSESSFTGATIPWPGHRGSPTLPPSSVRTCCVSMTSTTGPHRSVSACRAT